jgi:agmatine deiminase
VTLPRRAVIAGGAAMLAYPSGAAPRFRVPAEDVPHAATLMQWPVSRQVYPDAGFLSQVQDTIARIAGAIAAFEPVILLAHPDDHATARARVPGGVALWDLPTEDLWARDSGPLVATDGAGGRAVVQLNFNGWGNRQVHARDGRIAAAAAARLGVPVIESGLVGEPGGVEQDGAGLLIAHASSWVHPNRNPGLSRAEIGRRLLAAYGAERLVWAPGLKDRDITDYHIDSLARLTGPGRVLIQLPDRPDPRDPFHRAALRTRDILAAEGLALTVIADPVRPRIRHADFVASYANFYVCNGAVIAAEFGDRDADAAARAALAAAYPGREIVMLNVDALGEIGGGIHCATRELPA